MKKGLWRAVLLFVCASSAIAVMVWLTHRPRPVTVSVGQFPEELVYVRSDDDIINGGAMFRPPAETRNPVAVIWVHGWSANFYSPTYTMIGRELAARGVTTFTVNTRMHDIGTNAGERKGKRLRGGGYWGITSEDARDIAAWIDFAQARGFARVVVAGHSAGWASVAAYQATRRDPRVAGLVLASGTIAAAQPADIALVAQARRLVREGSGDDLIRLPGRSFPAFVSAATLQDQADTPPQLADFFGVETHDPGITRVTSPLLAFYGTRGDVGDHTHLARLRSYIGRQTSGPHQVDTAMIAGGDHMYTGEEAQVATVIAEWIERVVRTSP